MQCSYRDVKPTVEGMMEVDCSDEAMVEVTVYAPWATLIDSVCEQHACALLRDANEAGWGSEYEALEERESASDRRVAALRDAWRERA